MIKKPKILALFYNNENNKVLTNNIIASFSIKGMAMLLGILTTPAYINYFNNQSVLGVWFTLVAIFGWVLNFDLGIGNGLRNRLVEALVKNNKKGVQEYISSAYIMLGVISALGMMAGMIVLRYINLNKLLNIPVETISNSILLISVQIIFVGIILQFWLKLILSILYAMQKTALPNLLTLISNSLLLCYLFLFKTNDISLNLVNLSIVQVVSVNVPLIVISIITFVYWLGRPSFKYFRWDYARSITSLGGAFFIIQLALMVILSTNDILISWFYSPKYVVEYQIYNKWFYLTVVLFSLLTQPMWSAFSKAYEEKRFAWISKVYNLFNIFALVGTIGCISLAIIFQLLVNIWLGEHTILVQFSTIMYFVFVSTFMMFINASTSVANAFSKLKCQLICLSIGIFIKLFLTFICLSFIKDWSFIVAINAIALLPLVVAQPIASRRILKKAMNS